MLGKIGVFTAELESVCYLWTFRARNNVLTFSFNSARYLWKWLFLHYIKIFKTRSTSSSCSQNGRLCMECPKLPQSWDRR